MIDTVPTTAKGLRIVDRIMRPVMFILGGFREDAIQETHPWHCWRGFDAGSIDISCAAKCRGSDDKTFKRRYGFLFHAPLIGGWKKYRVFSPKSDVSCYRIGWLIYHDTILVDACINTLLIRDERVRMLEGPTGMVTYFFAINDNGAQIPLYEVGSGTLGDKKYGKTRLL